MSDMDKQKLKQEAVPFFARYLEGQINFIEEISEEEMQTVVGGGKGVKKKLPNHKKHYHKKHYHQKHSSGCGGIVTTKKFPSDNADVSGGGIVTTMKFPSDGEDVPDGGIVTTMKFPSDNADVSGSVG